MFVAEVEFLGIARGGRTTPPQSGFRPQIEAGDVHTSCVVEAMDGESVFEFDKEYRVLLRMLYPEEYGTRLSIGSRVRLFEGSRLIGQGRIIDVR